MATPNPLSDYIKEKIFKARGLNAEKIGKMSKGRLTAAYLRELVSGKSQHPSIEVLKTLADVAKTDPAELILVASNLPVRNDTWSAEEALETMGKVVRSPELTQILRLIEDKDPEELKSILSSLKRKIGKPR